jgi:hypothetical protein
MSDRSIDEDQVRREQLADVNVPAQWAYLAAVLFGGLLLMLVLIGLLGT